MFLFNILSWICGIFSFFLLVVFLVWFYFNISIHLILCRFSIWNIILEILVTCDWISSLFSFIVCLISSVVFMYAKFYMFPRNYIKSFLVFTFSFIFSILIIIFFSDLLFLMLGWDGLGFSSFFLVLFYIFFG